MAASHVPGDVPFFLSHAGRSLLPGDLLPTRGLSGSILQIQGRLEGGGGDGGSTGAESRSCYLEMYAGKKKDKVDPREEALARWTRCRLTNEPLAEPCVADDLGNMYNKEAVLNALLTKTVPKGELAKRFSWASMWKRRIICFLKRSLILLMPCRKDYCLNNILYFLCSSLLPTPLPPQPCTTSPSSPSSPSSSPRTPTTSRGRRTRPHSAAQSLVRTEGEYLMSLLDRMIVWSPLRLGPLCDV